MAEFLYNIDKYIFYFINHSLSNTVFDKFFPFITEVKHWYIVYFILWMILFFKGGRLGKIAAITTIFLITVSDQISSSLIKNFVERIRPCNDLPDVNLLVFCSGSYSMPSSHAVNNFAMATFFSLLFAQYKWTLFITASLMALSRPYVGVHYPSDIIIGALIGAFIGYVFAKIVLYIKKVIDKKYPLRTNS